MFTYIHVEKGLGGYIVTLISSFSSVDILKGLQGLLITFAVIVLNKDILKNETFGSPEKGNDLPQISQEASGRIKTKIQLSWCFQASGNFSPPPQVSISPPKPPLIKNSNSNISYNNNDKYMC